MDDGLRDWIPFLRRFARAATGEIASSDDAVHRCVERLLAEDPSGGSSREHAFHELAQELSEVPVATSGSRLALLPLRQRLALLLSRLEEMPIDQVARTLDLSQRRAAILIEAALTALRAPEAAKVLIIEHPTAEVDEAERSALARDFAAAIQGRNAAALILTLDVAFAEEVAHRSLLLQPATGALIPWKVKRGWFR